MQLLEFTDASSFLHHSSRFLLQSEAENNLLLSSALSLARGANTRPPRHSFYLVRDDGKPVLAALNLTDRRLVVSSTDLAAVRFFAHDLAARTRAEPPTFRTSGLFISESIAAGFLEGWTDAAFLFQHRQTQLGLISASSIAKSGSLKMAAGLFRAANRRDAKTLLRWARQLSEESGLAESPEETADVLHRSIENRQLFVWEDPEIVAMAGFGGFTPNGARLNMVFTDPNRRHRGYAAAIVQTLTRRLLADPERKFCFLFVAAENAAALALYERLGFQVQGRFADHVVASSVSTTGK